MGTRHLTEKGTRQAAAVLAAAIRCLGRDGYAGTSLARVAEEAGVQKRMVLYYFGSREALVAAALERLGEDFLSGLEERLDDATHPAAVVDAVLDVVLAQAQDRALLAAYYGLLAEAATDETLQAAFDDLRGRAVALAHRVLDTLEAHGHALSMDRELLILAASAGAHGMGLELLRDGTSPAIERAVAFARLGAAPLLFD